MKIDIWSDFACPFCYIGKRHLEQALDGREDVEIVFHSFELDPHAHVHYEEDIHQLLANKYNLTYEQAKANNNQVAQMAAATGLHYDFDKMQLTNTFTAHRLAQYAKEQGKGNEFVEATFDAYFTAGAFLNDEETLVAIGTSVGLPEADLRRIINSKEYLAPVRVDQTEAVELGIQSVPFFLINDQYAVSGAQPVEVFEQVLSQVQSKPVVAETGQAPSCEDGTCKI